jgi:large subunit ribosomal protein L21
MYAVLETGGKQHRIAVGDTIRVESIPGEVGSTVDLGRVVALVDDGAVTVGSQAGSARVKATITEHGRGDKIIVFKFKRKKQYKKTIGHRQNYTAVKIDDITV